MVYGLKIYFDGIFVTCFVRYTVEKILHFAITLYKTV